MRAQTNCLENVTFT